MLKEKILRNWTNFRGWRTDRRLVVFESDDWGATRLRDPGVLNTLLKQGICLASNSYDRFDCLEDRGDLERLFDILDGHRDRTNKPPIFTLNTIMGNPDFDAIKAGNFGEYIWESMWDSYLRYHGQDLREFWNAGIKGLLIKPQYHGREHLNVGLWMGDLLDGCDKARLAFDHDYFGITRTSTSGQRHYFAAFWPVSRQHLREIQEIIVDGLLKFEEFFGFASRTFVACNYVLPAELEPTLLGKGVELIQGSRGQLAPSADGKVSVRRSYTGQRNALGQLYSVRNVMFEPFEDQSRDWVASAMAEIKESFFWRKPAIIQTHRVNYVGGMDPANRDQSLEKLDRLLASILATWPDVEFLSSDQLLNELQGQRPLH